MDWVQRNVSDLIGVFRGFVPYTFLHGWHRAASAGLVSPLPQVLHPTSCDLTDHQSPWPVLPDSAVVVLSENVTDAYIKFK